MAAEQMKKVIGHHLTCPICDESYKKPKYLPCYHSYCEECLVKLVVQSNITCPECNETSILPSGVKHLPNNFFINRLLDEAALKRKVEAGAAEEAKCDLCIRGHTAEVLCLDCSAFLCTHCIDNHKYSRDWYNHSLMPLNELHTKKKEVIIKPKAKHAMCQKHELELNFYCETCNQLICHYCVVKKHTKHQHGSAKEMADKHRTELDKIVEPVDKMIAGLSVACKNVIGVKDKIVEQADCIDKEIDRHYEELHQRIQQQRDELKKELHEVSTQKKEGVTLQLEQMEHAQAQLESIKELSSAIKNGSDQEALLMKKQVADYVKRVSDNFSKLDSEPAQLVNMEFIPTEEYKKSVPQFGQLFHDGACPPNCEVDFPKWFIEREVAHIKVITKDHSNYLCHKGGSKIVIQVQSSRGDVTPVEVKDNKDGSYSASFVANQVGEIKLSVTIKGQQINGSPFNVKVHGKYTTIDKPLKIIDEGGRMGEPHGIAFGRDGIYAVVDYNNCVWIYDREDQLVRKFGSKGTGNVEFNGPYGVAFDDDNHLYVTDSGNNRVLKFDTNGTYLLKFGTFGRDNGQLSGPIGITVHGSEVYIVENDNNRISVFQRCGKFSRIIGLDHLCHPWYIEVSSSHLLVADCGHQRISIFTLDGTFLGKYGTQGTTSKQLNGPCGIATDMFGYIFATEYGNSCVSVFNKDGAFIHRFGSKGSGLGQFSFIRGIAISPTGEIYVCDAGNKRIQMFST